MEYIPLNITSNKIIETLKNCRNNDSCNSYSNSITLCKNNVLPQDPFINNNNNIQSVGDYNNLLDNIIRHFNYIIKINKATKDSFSKKINNDILNQRYVYYDSLDIDYENTWVKKLIFWLYFFAIIIYIFVFILKKLYKKKIEFLYLFIIIILPKISSKLMSIINYFYNFNILFTKN